MENLLTALKNALLSYMEQRPNLSLRSIARNSKIDRYFLSKIINGDSNSSIDMNKVLLLCKYLTEKENIREIIDSSSSEIQKELKNIFSVNYDNGNERYAFDPDVIDLYNPTEYFVLVLSTYANGTTREYIQRILGESGIIVLDEFLRKEILVEKAGVIKLAKGEDFFVPFKILKHHIANYARYYNSDHVGKERNFLHIVSQGLTREALKEAQDYHREFYSKIHGLINDPSKWGNIPFFSIGMLDTFVDDLEKDN